MTSALVGSKAKYPNEATLARPLKALLSPYERAPVSLYFLPSNSLSIRYFTLLYLGFGDTTFCIRLRLLALGSLVTMISPIEDNLFLKVIFLPTVGSLSYIIPQELLLLVIIQ